MLNNLAKIRTGNNVFLTPDDIRKRARYDLFVISRVLQRFILTMAMDRINRPSLPVHSRISQINSEIIRAYQGIAAAKTEEEIIRILESLYDNFRVIEDAFKEMIMQHSTMQYSYGEYNDIVDIKKQFGDFHIPYDIFRGIGTSSAHVNMFIPYAETLDTEYIVARSMITALTAQFPRIRCYGFSLSDNRWRQSYYKYLSSEWTHCEIRYKTFDAVFMTWKSAFNPNQSFYQRLYNYARPGGTIFIYGLRNDFLPNHCEKLAMTLEDIQVRFFSHSAMVAEAGGRNDFCLIIGRTTSNPRNWQTTYNQLMDAFLMGHPLEGDFTVTGSEEDVVPFRSYNLTEEEYVQLMPLLHQSEKGLTQFLFPKNRKDTRRPLLPFTSGQLGLVLISGDINGIVEESDTHCRHAVKGSSSRKSKQRTEPVLNNDGEEVGRKVITTTYPITTVQLVTASGNIYKIGGKMPS